MTYFKYSLILKKKKTEKQMLILVLTLDGGVALSLINSKVRFSIHHTQTLMPILTINLNLALATIPGLIITRSRHSGVNLTTCLPLTLKLAWDEHQILSLTQL